MHRQKGLDSLVIIDAPALLHGDWMSKGLDSLVIIDAPAVLHGDWMSAPAERPRFSRHH